MEEDAEAAEQETPPQPPEPQPPQQSLAAQPLALLSPPEEVGGDEHEGVIVCENMVVEVGGVMARDGGKGMMGSTQMDKEKKLLRQQLHQQQPQLPGAAAPNPWPLPQPSYPSQQSVEAQQLPLLSPPQEVGGDEHEGVLVSENTVEVGGVVACDGGKRMMEMDKKEELLQQQPNQQQPSSSRTSSSLSYLVLPTQTRGHPQCQQVLLMRATAIGRSQAMIFRFLFCEAEQQQGRLRLENANNREARAIASRRAIGSDKALALVGSSAPSRVGGMRRPVGALPVRGEHVYAKRGEPTTTGCEDRKACNIFNFFQVPKQF